MDEAKTLSTKQQALYVIKRDNDGETPWLLNFMPSGCREYSADGTLRTVYTCLWGMHQRGAMKFTDKTYARRIAESIGKCELIELKRSDDQ